MFKKSLDVEAICCFERGLIVIIKKKKKGHHVDCWRMMNDDDAVKIGTKEAKMKPYVIEIGRRGHIYVVNNVFQLPRLFVTLLSAINEKPWQKVPRGDT